MSIYAKLIEIISCRIVYNSIGYTDTINDCEWKLLYITEKHGKSVSKSVRMWFEIKQHFNPDNSAYQSHFK